MHAGFRKERAEGKWDRGGERLASTSRGSLGALPPAEPTKAGNTGLREASERRRVLAGWEPAKSTSERKTRKPIKKKKKNGKKTRPSIQTFDSPSSAKTAGRSVGRTCPEPGVPGKDRKLERKGDEKGKSC